jgi:hypothetical protein
MMKTLTPFGDVKNLVTFCRIIKHLDSMTQTQFILLAKDMLKLLQNYQKAILIARSFRLITVSHRSGFSKEVQNKNSC